MIRRSQHLGILMVNAILMSLPIFVSGRGSISTAALWGFLTGGALLCRADLSRLSCGHIDDRLPKGLGTQLVCALTGMTVLATWWVCLVLHAAQPGLFVGLGCSLMVAGSWLRRSAVLSLGRDFVSDVTPTTRSFLRTGGIYSWVRHPSELGLLLTVFGGCLMLGSIAGLLFSLVTLLPLSMLRVRWEERSLRSRFGNDYARYAQQVGGYLPLPRTFVEAMGPSINGH